MTGGGGLLDHRHHPGGGGLPGGLGGGVGGQHPSSSVNHHSIDLILGHGRGGQKDSVEKGTHALYVTL